MTPRDAGYSLRETLVAFAVLALGLSVLIPAFTSQLDRIARAERTWIAHEIAANVLAEAGRLHTVSEDRSGEWDGRFAWRLQSRLQPAEPGMRAPHPPVYHLRIRVFGPGGEALVDIETLGRDRL